MQRPVAWMPFLLTKTAKQISIMTSVFRADNALSTVLLVRLLINPRFFQTIRAIQSGEKVYAAVAPAFVGQFGPKVTPGKLRAAMKALGFADVFEVAIGADLCAKQEAEDFLKRGTG